MYRPSTFASEMPRNWFVVFYVECYAFKISLTVYFQEANYAVDSFAGSDDEIDHYKETVKAEGKERAAGESESDSEDDDYDLDEDLSKRRKERVSIICVGIPIYLLFFNLPIYLYSNLFQFTF